MPSISAPKKLTADQLAQFSHKIRLLPDEAFTSEGP
jgi:hypothetical protein